MSASTRRPSGISSVVSFTPRSDSSPAATRALEDGEQRARVRPGERDPRGRHGLRLAERTQRLGRHEGDVDRECHDGVVRCGAKPGDEAVDGGAPRRAVVEDSEREPPVELPGLAHHEHLVAGLDQQPVPTLPRASRP